MALAEQLTAAFRAAGLRAATLDDARSMKWSKLVTNLAGNATSAIVNLPPGEVYADPRGYEVERRQLREAFAVIRRSGLRVVALPGADVRLLDLATRLPNGARPADPALASSAAAAARRRRRCCSRHVPGRRSRRSSWLNGAVARAAADLGGAATVNRRLSELVAEVLTDPDRRAWFDGRVDRLAAEVGVTG